MKTPGYCELCRKKEIELYGEVLNKAGHRHIRSVRMAGCLHPAAYTLAVPSDGEKQEVIEFEDEIRYYIHPHKQRAALWALNNAHVGKTQIPFDEPCPKELQDATHQMLCSYTKRVMVSVYKDGSISLKIKE